MCRGKKPMREPRRRAPNRKNVNPVKMDENEKATTVVAMIAWGLSSPISAAMVFARMWKNGYMSCRKKEQSEKGRQNKIGMELWVDVKCKTGTNLPLLQSSYCRLLHQIHFRRMSTPIALLQHLKQPCLSMRQLKRKWRTRWWLTRQRTSKLQRLQGSWRPRQWERWSFHLGRVHEGEWCKCVKGIWWRTWYSI